jgi:tape measure domain-containing protein
LASAIDIIVKAQDRASKTINNIGKSFDSISKRAEKAMGVVSAIGLAGGAGLTAVMVEGIKMNSTLEQSEARWTTLLKSSEKAEKQMAWIKSYAKQTPFDYKAIDQTATSLMGMGLGLKDVQKWMPALGDAAAVLGGGSDTVNGLGLALGQMNAKGKVSAEEMQQLAERGVNAWQMLADGMGMTQGEVRKLSEDGKLLAEDALPLIYEGMQKTFGGGTQNLMKSTTGQAMLARENFATLAGTLTQGAFDWFGANVLPLINSGLEALTTVFSGGLIEGFETLWNSGTKAKVVLVALAGIIVGALLAAFFALAPAVVSAVVAFAPFLAVGALIAGLAILIMKNWGPVKEFFVKTFGGIYTQVVGYIQQLIAYIQPAIGVIVNFFKEKLNLIKQFWAEHGQMVIEAVSNFLDILVGIFKFIFPAIKLIVMSVWEAIKAIITGALNIIMSVVQIFGALFTGNWSALWDGIKSLFSSIWGLIVDLFKAIFVVKLVGIIINFVSNVRSKIFAFVNTMLGKFTAFAVGVVKKFTDFTSKAWSLVSAFIPKVVSGLAKMISSTISSISSWVSNMVSKVADMVTKFISKVVKLRSDMISKMSDMWNSLKQTAKDGVNKMVDTIKGMAKTFLSAGKGLVDAFIKGVKDTFSKAPDAVAGGLKKVRNLLPFSPAKTGPLSDLDKSGQSFFPTFVDGMMRGVSPMVRNATKGMDALSKTLDREAEGMSLSSFTGGSQKVRVVHEHKHTGSVKVNGDTSSETVKMTGQSLREETEDTFFSDFRRSVRSR